MVDVLIVDDDELIREMLLEIMRVAGIKAVATEDGTNAMKIVKDENVRLVITDLIMPGKEGLETIISLKKETPQVKIIAISGGGRISPESYLGIARDIGAQYTFTKPFDRKKLLGAVRDCLQG